MSTQRQTKNVELKKTEIGSALTEVAPDFIKKLNKNEREKLGQALVIVEQKQTHSVSTHHSGPIPAPETIESYDKIIPNGAERIMVMAEEQSAHRRKMEDSVISSQNKLSERGQVFAFILSIILIGTGVASFLTGHDGVAGTIFGVTIVGLVTVFIVGKKSQSKNLENKAQQSNR